MILVTGGCGFIGSNFILEWVKNNNEPIINIDSLTYASRGDNLKELSNNNNYTFFECNIKDSNKLEKIFTKYSPKSVINFAAESHVDKSIDNPRKFVDSNIVGTFNLLDISRKYWSNLNNKEKNTFKFVHISTDEVYGSLKKNDLPFTEENRFKPNSPYSASKASSDHLVRSYYKTYSFPAIISNCSNNYGPYQFPEKLIPLVIQKCLLSENIPVYGNGLQVRDWLHVQDHCTAIKLILKSGKNGQVYNIGGKNEKTNIEVVNYICELLDEFKPSENINSYKELIVNIDDRPGHDVRYAINSDKITKDLGWKPAHSFDQGIRSTVVWYLENLDWMNRLEENT